MVWTLTTSQACLLKSGANANISQAALAIYEGMAEAVINTTTRYDWVANYGSVNANFQQILSDCASDLVAMKLIIYDTSGFSPRREAEVMLDVLRDNYIRNIEILKQKENQEKVV